MRTELRMAALGGSKTVRSRKAAFIHYLFPRHIVFAGIGQIKIPGNIPDSLTDIGRRILTQGFEKRVTLIPKFLLYQLLQGVGFKTIASCTVVITGQLI